MFCMKLFYQDKDEMYDIKQISIKCYNPLQKLNFEHSKDADIKQIIIFVKKKSFSHDGQMFLGATEEQNVFD